MCYIYNVENVVPQEGEAILSIAEGNVWQPVSVYK